VLVEQPEFRTFSIKMNYQNGPFTDPALRKAVSYAFDYEAMLAAEGPGHAVLMQGPLPPGILGADPKLEVPRMDLNKAKEWLAKSKYPNGGIKLTYTARKSNGCIGVRLRLDSNALNSFPFSIYLRHWPGDRAQVRVDPVGQLEEAEHRTGHQDARLARHGRADQRPEDNS
jgi:ABC-type oligopeptide transport system substrate-binding subunit